MSSWSPVVLETPDVAGTTRETVLSSTPRLSNSDKVAVVQNDSKKNVVGLKMKDKFRDRCG